MTDIIVKEFNDSEEIIVSGALKGDAGQNGVGVPVGGLLGQVLAKASGDDFDTEWADQSGGGGGYTQKSQTFIDPEVTPEIEQDTTFVYNGGATSMTIEDALVDGHLMVIESSEGTEIIGSISGAQDYTYTVPPNVQTILFISLDVTPLGLTGITWIPVPLPSGSVGVASLNNLTGAVSLASYDGQIIISQNGNELQLSLATPVPSAGEGITNSGGLLNLGDSLFNSNADLVGDTGSFSLSSQSSSIAFGHNRDNFWQRVLGNLGLARIALGTSEQPNLINISVEAEDNSDQGSVIVTQNSVSLNSYESDGSKTVGVSLNPNGISEISAQNADFRISGNGILKDDTSTYPISGLYYRDSSGLLRTCTLAQLKAALNALP